MEIKELEHLFDILLGCIEGLMGEIIEIRTTSQSLPIIKDTLMKIRVRFNEKRS